MRRVLTLIGTALVLAVVITYAPLRTSRHCGHRHHLDGPSRAESRARVKLSELREATTAAWLPGLVGRQPPGGPDRGRSPRGARVGDHSAHRRQVIGLERVPRADGDPEQTGRERAEHDPRPVARVGLGVLPAPGCGPPARRCLGRFRACVLAAVAIASVGLSPSVAGAAACCGESHGLGERLATAERAGVTTSVRWRERYGAWSPLG